MLKEEYFRESESFKESIEFFDACLFGFLYDSVFLGVGFKVCGGLFLKSGELLMRPFAVLYEYLIV